MYVSFGDVARGQLGEQCQYASRYIQGKLGYECLGDGLRFQNLNTGNYHEIQIHQDDVAEFVRRYKQLRG